MIKDVQVIQLLASMMIVIVVGQEGVQPPTAT